MDLLEFVMDLHSFYYSVLKNMIPFTIGLDKKSDIRYVFSCNYARVKVDSYDSLPIAKMLILHNLLVSF